MFGVTVSELDDSGISKVQLSEILELIGQEAMGGTWRIENVEAIGGDSERLHLLSDKRALVSGSELVEISRMVHQIIDGTFSGFAGEVSQPWIVITAVDGSAFDATSDDLEVIRCIHRNFTTAEFIPGMEPPQKGQ